MHTAICIAKGFFLSYTQAVVLKEAFATQNVKCSALRQHTQRTRMIAKCILNESRVCWIFIKKRIIILSLILQNLLSDIFVYFLIEIIIQCCLIHI